MGYYYVLYLILIMVAAGVIKDLGYLHNFFNYAYSKIKSKRIVVALISLVSGVMPITGRVAVSAGILQSVAPDAQPSRSKFGIIDYLSTHHYYLWSPLEKTIILPMAALSLSYVEMLSYTGFLLAITLIYIFAYLFFKVKESDIDLQLTNAKTQKPLQFFTHYINWGLLVVVVAVIYLSGVVKSYDGEIKAFIESSAYLNMETVQGFISISTIAFLASLAMGSSSKYAGIVALLGTIYGVAYLPWFIAIEYSGYLLSPMHKCLHIGRMYFGTPWKEYLQVLGVWVALMLAYGLLSVSSSIPFLY